MTHSPVYLRESFTLEMSDVRPDVFPLTLYWNQDTFISGNKTFFESTSFLFVAICFPWKLIKSVYHPAPQCGLWHVWEYAYYFSSHYSSSLIRWCLWGLGWTSRGSNRSASVFSCPSFLPRSFLFEWRFFSSHSSFTRAHFFPPLSWGLFHLFRLPFSHHGKIKRAMIIFQRWVLSPVLGSGLGDLTLAGCIKQTTKKTNKKR